MPNSKRSDDINKAFGELAELFPFGELMAQTQPAEFIRMVASEIRRLRDKADAEGSE